MKTDPKGEEECRFNRGRVPDDSEKRYQKVFMALLRHASSNGEEMGFYKTVYLTTIICLLLCRDH